MLSVAGTSPAGNLRYRARHLRPFDCTARREERRGWRLRGNRASLLDKDEASPAVQELELPSQLVPRPVLADVPACPEILRADSNVID